MKIKEDQPDKSFVVSYDIELTQIWRRKLDSKISGVLLP
jgi:hypothetical protein